VVGSDLGAPGLVPGGRFAVLCCREPFRHLPSGAGGFPAMLVVGFTGRAAEGFVLGGWSVCSGEPRLVPCSSEGVIAPAAARPPCVIFSSYPLR